MGKEMGKEIAQVLDQSLISSNEFDSNGEIANVVDGLFAIARALNKIANGGGGSLGHEICMGIRKGLFGSEAPASMSIFDWPRHEPDA
jgi:hypothetical protein